MENVDRRTSDTPKGEATRSRLLSAAEEMFAINGFDGASTRMIADKAGVPPGLVGYHFTNKLNLYEAVFERRIENLVDQRMAGLRIAKLEPDPACRVELIVKAMLVPMFTLRASPENAAFGMLLAREVMDSRGNERGITNRMFDPFASEVTEALASCFPDWSVAELHWAYHTLLGAMFQIIADSGRIERLSGGACSPDDADAAATNVGAILAAGFLYRNRRRSERDRTDNDS